GQTDQRGVGVREAPHGTRGARLHAGSDPLDPGDQAQDRQPALSGLSAGRWPQDGAGHAGLPARAATARQVAADRRASDPPGANTGVLEYALAERRGEAGEREGSRHPGGTLAMEL